MSIDMDGPKTAAEKIDVARNLVHQMYLANMVGDGERFEKSFKEADALLFDAAVELEEMEEE